MHPDLGTDVYFAGLARPAFGSQPVLGELQARMMVHFLKNPLPEKNIMQATIDSDKKSELEQFGKAGERIKTLVDYPIYTHSLAAIIGCLPDMKKIIYR